MRQVCACKTCGVDFIPLNGILPEHENIIITRNLEELICFLPLGVSYGDTYKCLERFTHDPDVLSPREVQNIVMRHGQRIRQTEDEHAKKVLEKDKTSVNESLLISGKSPRRKTNWTERITNSVEGALNAKEFERPPDGVSSRDWDRIITQVKEHDKSIEFQEITSLGPKLKPSELLIAIDGIVVRGRKKKSKLELRIAYLKTSKGYRYITGTGKKFLKKVLATIKVLNGNNLSWIVLADGGKWIRNFYEEELAYHNDRELILDWYHLAKKCKEFMSMIAYGGQQRKELLRQLVPLLWEGYTEKAVQYLENLRQKARNIEKLEELIGYLGKHSPYIPNYRERRKQCKFNSSNSAERACNTLVARRQKNKSMHWIEKGADALCALQTLWHNIEWDVYWKKNSFLSLARV